MMQEPASKEQSHEDSAEIYIYIASCREKYLIQTVKSATQNAKSPGRVFFGIFNTILDDSERIFDPLLTDNRQVFYLEARSSEPLGIGYSRMCASRLATSPLIEYFLQIDAHTVFTKHWDSVLISNLNTAEKVHPKAVLSTMPQRWIEDELDPSKVLYRGNPEWEVNPYDFDEQEAAIRFGTGIAGTAPGIHSGDKSSAFKPYVFGEIDHFSPEINFIEAGAIHAAFVFGRYSLIREFLHDPDNIFDGDQLNYTLRLKTRGYKIFTFRHPVFLSKDKFRNGELADSYDWRHYEKNNQTRLVRRELGEIDQDRIFEGHELGYWGAPSLEELETAKELMNIRDFFSNRVKSRE